MTFLKPPAWLRSIVIEPYMFLMTFTIGIAFVPMEQLQQDKICLLEYNQTVEYCLSLSASRTTDTKLAILASSNQFTQYKQAVDTIPGMIWCLICGSVCDRYPRTRKPFMIATVCSGLVRDTLFLLNIVYFYEWGLPTLLVSAAIPTFFGSLWVGITLSLTYVATHTSKENRVIRFLTTESALYLAQASGNLISGQLLKRKSWIGGLETRNYSAIFILGIICSILCILWTIFRVEFKNIAPTDAYTNADSDIEIGINNNREETTFKRISDSEESKLQPELESKETNKKEENNSSRNRVNIAKEILSPKHVIASFQTVIRKRNIPGVRKQILLLMLAHILINTEKLGMTKIMFTFTQRLFKWNFEMYSYMSMVSPLTGPMVTLIFIPFFAKVCKLVDMEIAIIGVVSLMLSTISIGSILNPIGYYVSLSLSSLSNSASISIRSKMSKIIDRNEVTQIFGALTTIEVLCPFIAVAMYTNIFNATMKYYPTLIMQISTMTLFVPLINFIVIDLFLDKKKIEIQTNKILE